MDENAGESYFSGEVENIRPKSEAYSNWKTSKPETMGNWKNLNPEHIGKKFEQGI